MKKRVAKTTVFEFIGAKVMDGIGMGDGQGGDPGAHDREVSPLSIVSPQPSTFNPQP